VSEPNDKAPRRARVAAWGATGAWAAGIFTLSCLNHATTGLPFPQAGWDKPVHATFFAVLGGLTAVALRCEGKPWVRAALWGAALAALYGVTDELHQRFTPDRTCDVTDALADAVGGLLGGFASAGRVADAFLALAARGGA
jgi:VanZ family protein